MPYKVVFNKPYLEGKELKYVAQTVLYGQKCGDGLFAKRCEELMETRFKASKVLLTTSCTSALEMAAMLCGIEAGDEVIMPSYTFVSTANAFCLRGAIPKFVDIRHDTLNMDENLIEAAITEKTKAIVPVHYAGVGCEMDKITAIAKKYDLQVIEDAAQGVNAKYKGKNLGTFGNLGSFSFHETKNIICGEGGALVVNDPKFIEPAEIIREKGTNRSQFFRGQVDKYTWVDLGSSYVPSEILTSFLYAQLESMDSITRMRKRVYQSYFEKLAPLQDEGLLTLPEIPDECESNYHMFYIRVTDFATRTKLLKHLKEQGVMAVFHYVPLHDSPMGEKYGYRKGMLPETEKSSVTLVRLPFYNELEEVDICMVCDEIYSYFSVSQGLRMVRSG